MIVPLSTRPIMHWCHWPLVNDTNALSLIYTKLCKFVSLTKLHSCNWPLPKEGWLSLSREALSCIGVIDNRSMTRMHWVWFKPNSVHSCHWPMCIRVIDHWVWFTPRCVHSCHWPLLKGPIWTRVGIRVIDQCAFMSLTTECDLQPAVCIRVIDHY